MINATSILGTYEIGNPTGRNYSNNVARRRKELALAREIERGREGEGAGEMESEKRRAGRRNGCT